MPFTFVEIEQRKSRNVELLFAFLVLLYAGSLIALVTVVKLFLEGSWRFRWQELIPLGVAALLLACVQWLAATRRLLDRVLLAILAHPPDPGDTYHNRLKNIIDEVSVATGNRYRIEPYVISTPAMNACALSDFSGRAAIAVTEGLLARLNRSQLEAVIGHEAAHIASGDSVSRSLFCGLFGLHEVALKRLGGMLDDSGSEVRSGRGVGLILLIIAVLWVTTQTKRLCELLISREQEYRADAVAVRLTRNPLGLAGALGIMEKHWRGIGTEVEAFSTIFIMDSGGEYLSEREGYAAEWFSTHPPTKRRIEALLAMTAVRPEDFERTLLNHPTAPKERYPGEAVLEPALPRWFISFGEAWQGPFGLEELSLIEALAPDTWVRREGTQAVIPAYQDPRILGLLRRRYSAEPLTDSRTQCPNCRLELARVMYEGVPLDECPACHGCYATTDQISRLFAREHYEFSESTRRLAKAILSSPRRPTERRGQHPHQWLQSRSCAACGSAVVRKFYTEAYPVEVEQCWMCGLAWLDRGERELLQCLYEMRQ